MNTTKPPLTDQCRAKRVVVRHVRLGKTHVSAMLRENADWFHYSIDYRIGTRYISEYIADNAKAEAMANRFFRNAKER
jgi:hypothetical protein